jgi:hypothetical protein
MNSDSHQWITLQYVLKFYGAHDGNLRGSGTNGGHVARDGFTATLWRDDMAMTQAAYGDGPHRTFMDISHHGSMLDRSSFNRAHLVRSSGSWDGDPAAGLM